MKRINKNVWVSILLIGSTIVSNLGCKKFIQAELPIDKVPAQSVFSNTGSASAVLSGIYFDFGGDIIAGGQNSASVITGLTGDELVLHNINDPFLLSLITNSLSSGNGQLNYRWDKFYEFVYRLNSFIQGVNESDGIPDRSKNEFIAQAKFMRAYIYFYLVNFYSGVPIVLSTDYKKNMLLPRASVEECYHQIIKDLTEARSGISDDYLMPDLITISTERVTANKSAASALLARVYLYTEDWNNAELEASKVISNSRYSLVSLNDVFLSNSDETIWQVEGDKLTGVNSQDGKFFIPEFSTVIPTVYLSESLLNIITGDDKRREYWLSSVLIGSERFYYPFKYKQRSNPGSVTSEYNMMLRLAEQYLIRAEARAHLKKIDEATEDLNFIRERAGLSGYTALTESTLLAVIEKERQVELFSEGGHRWFDLIRTGRADQVLGPIKGSDWQPTDKLFPIPAKEFLLNPSLRGHQNPGYSEN